MYNIRERRNRTPPKGADYLDIRAKCLLTEADLLAGREARRKYMQAYRQANNEKLRTYQREWARANPDKVRAAQERYWAKRACVEQTRTAGEEAKDGKS